MKLRHGTDMIISCDCGDLGHSARLTWNLWEDEGETLYLQVGHSFGDVTFSHRLWWGLRMFWNLVFRRHHFSEWADLSISNENLDELKTFINMGYKP